MHVCVCVCVVCVCVCVCVRIIRLYASYRLSYNTMNPERVSPKSLRQKVQTWIVIPHTNIISVCVCVCVCVCMCCMVPI